MRQVTLLVALAACTPGPGKEGDTGATELPADIVVSTVALRFGLLAPGEEEVKRFTVRNDGGAALEVGSIDIAGEAFTLLSEGTFTLEPGEDTDLDVAFRPPVGPLFEGAATLLSNDPDEPEVVVELVGEGEVPQLILEGSEDAFGDVFVPCTGRSTFTLRSAGTQPVTVSALELTGEPFVLVDPPALPLVLAPSETAQVVVEFGPAAAEVAPGELTALSDDPDGPDSVMLAPPGGYVSVQVDPFTAPIDAPVDILFALDRSCSMVTEGEELAGGYEAFITTVEEVTDDWRIGVVTEETGCFTNGILSPEIEGYAELFQEAVTTGERNPLSERLLALTDNALSATEDGRCNDGFLRDGALLHMIMISDEEDQSPLDWKDFVTRYLDYVAEPELLKISVIGDLYLTCGRGTGAAGYEEAALATGGLLLDVCDDAWSEQVDDLALASLTALREYTLSATPVPESIEVTVDGAVATDWSWEPERNVISFDPPPTSGEDIVVTYGVPDTCE